ncbi:glycosyltransferase [Bradyrhizobium sp. 49]|nr:glycosyltransferase [Bradyrhizobium sp. 84]MCK1374979.1 glycosyltransferase [Bradyrhizobium sp. 49]MCK1417855.1 glycosyltransferase [Bradyrhizobium sp. CW4]MCK1426340.1 glycosyltransferase [Bradyrhizobium sp. 87]
MKILHLIPTVDPKYGGPIEGILSSAPLLAALGHQRSVACLDHPTDPWIASFPLDVFPLGTRPTARRKLLRRWLPWVRYDFSNELIPWLKEHAREFDIIVVNGLWNYIDLAARSALSRSDVPYFVFTHGMLDPWFKKTYPIKHFFKQMVWWFSEGPLLARAENVIFTCDEERLLARNAFWPYRVREAVIRYGTIYTEGNVAQQTAAFYEKVPSVKDRKFLLFLSRIHPKKGCDLLIKAFAKTAHKDPNLDLLMAGPDDVNWTPELIALSESLGIRTRIHWPGMLRGDEKWGAFHASEMFILPSHQENFGIAVAEALACAKPVLISDKINIWREIDAQGAGLVAEDNLVGTISLIDRFLEMTPDAKSKMTKAARATFLMHFDMTTNIHQFIEILEGSKRNASECQQ